MKLLADTHAFLWFMAGDAKLSRRGRRALEDDENEWCVSAASVWEIAIKTSLGRLSLPARPDEYIAAKVQSGLRLLSIDWMHAAAVARLPWHHRDPFDRLLVAQAQTEHLAIVTGDPIFTKYGARVVW